MPVVGHVEDMLTDEKLDKIGTRSEVTEVFPCFFLSCKANARVKLTSRGTVRTLQK